MKELNIKATTGKLVRTLIVEDLEELGKVGAEVVAGVVRGIDEPAISFAGGSTPLPVYKKLVELVAEDALTFKKVRAFLLDDWFDLPPTHPNTFRHYLDQKLLHHVDIPKDRIHYFEGRVEDHMRTCFNFEQMLKKVGGVDLQILGIGTNGHIAFNEPGTPANARTRLIKLTDTTRLYYADYFDSLASVPHHACSQGLANIMESRSVLLLAAGHKKDEILYRTLKEPVTNEVPSSHLQNFEGDLTFVVDMQAARLFL